MSIYWIELLATDLKLAHCLAVVNPSPTLRDQRKLLSFPFRVREYSVQLLFIKNRRMNLGALAPNPPQSQAER